MEQRVGRIDRVRSHSDRRLSRAKEVRLPVQTNCKSIFRISKTPWRYSRYIVCLSAMNVFLRLMHEGLTIPDGGQRTINANQEFAKARRIVPQILESLKSAFPVRKEYLSGEIKELARKPEIATEIGNRFAALATAKLLDVDVTWEPLTTPASLQARQN